MMHTREEPREAATMGKSTRKLKFEQAMQRLDAIVAAMESGEIGIEDSIAKYEEAMALATHCRKILDEAEQRIQKIQLDSSGQPQATPFEPEGDAGEEDAD
jgi:exodeoxyribonuclease VII small subunit